MWPLPSSRWAAFPAPENSQVPPIAPDSEPLSRPLSPERCCLFLNLIKMGHTELSLCVWLLSGRVMSIRFTREISTFPRFYKTILIHIIYACVIYIMCICVHLCVYIYIYSYICTCFPALVVKNPPANAGDIRDMGSIPGSERSPGGGHGNPLQYSS